MTVSDFLRREGFSGRLREQYLFPLASAIWSTTLERIEDFPAATLVRFFRNHGFLGFFTQAAWRTVSGGAASYIAPLTAPYRQRIVLSAQIGHVVRDANGVTVRARRRPDERFDEIVFACHGDQVLAAAGRRHPAREGGLRWPSPHLAQPHASSTPIRPCSRAGAAPGRPGTTGGSRVSGGGSASRTT